MQRPELAADDQRHKVRAKSAREGAGSPGASSPVSARQSQPNAAACMGPMPMSHWQRLAGTLGGPGVDDLRG